MSEMEDLARDAMRPITPDIITTAERLVRSIDRMGDMLKEFDNILDETAPDITNNKEDNNVNKE
jgi:hypothetical protein